MPCVIVTGSDNEVATRVDMLSVCEISFEPKNSFVGGTEVL